MNARYKYWMTLALLGAISLPAFAQEGDDNNPPPPPPQRRDGDRGGDRLNAPPPRDDRPGLRGDDRGPRDGRDGRDGRRPDGPPQGNRPNPVPPVGEAGSPQVRAMMGYLSLVDEYKKLTQDPTAAGVAAVVTAGDILRPRGPQAAAEYFEKLLPKVSDPSIKNAIRLQLADFYRASNNADKALEHLSALMTQTDLQGNPEPEKKRE